MRRHIVRTNEKLVFEALASLESPVTNMLHDQLCDRIRKETFHSASVDLNRQVHICNFHMFNVISTTYPHTCSLVRGTVICQIVRNDHILNKTYMHSHTY